MLTVKVVDKKLTLVESELPKVNEDEMLVRMQSCGICGSDLEKVYGNYGMRSLRVGHEPAGVVIKVGKKSEKISGRRQGFCASSRKLLFMQILFTGQLYNV